MDKKIEGMLVDQMNFELSSAYIYLSMAAWFDSVNLSGFASWMKIQADEEKNHAMKMYHYLLESGRRPVWKAIDAPKAEWASPKEVFEDALKHEKAVTSRIYSIVDAAIELKDHATRVFLDWYVNEQVEEEANADEVLNKIAMVSASSQGLYMLDREMAGRRSD